MTTIWMIVFADSVCSFPLPFPSPLISSHYSDCQCNFSSFYFSSSSSFAFLLSIVLYNFSGFLAACFPSFLLSSAVIQ